MREGLMLGQLVLAGGLGHDGEGCEESFVGGELTSFCPPFFS
jgi:hypothetical protein